MKAIAISDISGGSAWSSEHTSWHYSTKSSQNLYHPVNISQDIHSTCSTKTSKVSRSLFGPSDPKESRRLECEEFNSQRYSDRSKWNFDFYQEKPISGRFDWRKCGNLKDTKQSSSGSLPESIWANRSPKKFSGQENFMDLKHSNSSSWNRLHDDSSLIPKSRSFELKKLY